MKNLAGFLSPGAIGTYFLKVANVGPEPTSGLITVSDPMPPGLELESADGMDWDCSSSTISLLFCTRSLGLVPGEMAPVITLRVNVAASVGTRITNVATVDTPGDTDPDNDSSSNTVTIARNATPAPALSVWGLLAAVLMLLAVALRAFRRGEGLI